MNLSHIETFVLVAEKRSLAAAARSLKISSAAVSKQLTRLESELGMQLLIRSTRHVELTEVGKSYYEECKRLLEEIGNISSFVSQMKATPHGMLKVVSGRHFAAAYIVPHLKEFLAKYPEVQLNLELAERIPDLENEALDVVIGMSIPAAENVIQKRIMTTRYAYCLSPGYAKKFGRPEKPGDLLHHGYITHSMRVPDCELVFNNAESVRLKPYLYVNDTETMLRLAEEGLGIVKLHHYVVKEALEKGKLEEVLNRYTEADIPIYVAFLQRRYIAAKTRVFIDFITAKIEAKS